jgi:hypothetical protein
MTERGSSLLVATGTGVATLALALASAGCGESSKSNSNAGDAAGQSSGGSAAGTSSGGSASGSGGSLVLDPNGGNSTGGKSCVDSQGHAPGSPGCCPMVRATVAFRRSIGPRVRVAARRPSRC